MTRTFTSIEDIRATFFPNPDEFYFPDDQDSDIQKTINEATKKFEDGLEAIFSRLGQTAVDTEIEA